MTLDKFGRHIDSVKKRQLNHHFKLDKNKNFDFQSKRLRNTGDAVDGKDAVNLDTGKKKFLPISSETKGLPNKRDFYDAKGSRIANVGRPIFGNDAITMDVVIVYFFYPIYKSIYKRLAEKASITSEGLDLNNFRKTIFAQLELVLKTNEYHDIFETYFPEIFHNKTIKTPPK